MILNEIIDDHYLPFKERKVRINTLKGYISSINLHIRPSFGHKEIHDITFMEVQQWVDNIPTPGGAEKAYKTLRQIIRWYISYFRDKELDDPTVGVERKKIPASRQAVFTKEEETKFLSGIKDHYAEAVSIAQLDLGLRKSEAFGLKWSDIDFETGKVHICRSKQYIDREEMIFPPKTALSDRWLKFSQKALNRLQILCHQSNSEWICPGDPNKISRELKTFALANDLPWVPMKNFRHTWATRAVENNVPIAIIGKWMGHTDINMAYKKYIQFSDQMVDNLAKDLNR